MSAIVCVIMSVSAYTCLRFCECPGVYVCVCVRVCVCVWEIELQGRVIQSG